MCYNETRYVGSYMDAYASLISVLVIVVLFIIALVILLILYLVIKTMILRERRRLGIKKAVGYTTLQLMRQISMAFLPLVIIGVIIGGIAGYYLTNPLFSLVFRSIGMVRVDFAISPLWIVILGALITLFSYAASMLIAWRIRKISAYALISE